MTSPLPPAKKAGSSESPSFRTRKVRVSGPGKSRVSEPTIRATRPTAPAGRNWDSYNPDSPPTQLIYLPGLLGCAGELVPAAALRSPRLPTFGPEELSLIVELAWLERGQS